MFQLPKLGQLLTPTAKTPGSATAAQPAPAAGATTSPLSTADKFELPPRPDVRPRPTLNLGTLTRPTLTPGAPFPNIPFPFPHIPKPQYHKPTAELLDATVYDRNDPTVGMTAEQRAAYDALPPDQRARYDELHRQGAHRGWGYFEQVDRWAVGNLRLLLLNGEVGKYMQLEASMQNSTDAYNLEALLFSSGALNYGKSRLNGGSTLLDHLLPLTAGGTTAQGVDRRALLSQLLADLSNPRGMVQAEGNKDCGGIAAAYLLCTTSPAEYAHIVTELAEKGEMNVVSFADFQFGGPASNILSETLKLRPLSPTSNQSLTQQIFAHTAVSMADDHDLPPMDVHVGGFVFKIPQTGLLGSEMDRMLSLLTGKKYDVMYIPNEPGEGNFFSRLMALNEASAMLEKQWAKHEPVVANYKSHWVVVNSVQGHGPDATVQFTDWTGRTASMPMHEFVGGLDSLVFDPSVAQAPAWMQNPAWDDPGGGGSVKPMTNGGGD